MLHILLMILKILGIVLLCILALLLTVLVLVLFVPVRYRIQAGKQEDIRASVKVTWLLHFVSVRFFYEGDRPGSAVRILGIPISAGDGEKSGKKTKKKPGAASGAPPLPAKDPESVPADGAGTAAFAEDDRNTSFSEDDRNTSDSGNDAGKQGFLERLKRTILSLYQKLLHFVRGLVRGVKKIRYTFDVICDKIKNAKENADYYIAVLSQERHKNAIRFVKSQVGRLFRHICPTKIKGYLLIGMDDPAQTGQLLAALGMFYPLYGKNIRIVPEFGRAVFLGEIDIKGRIMAFVLLRIAWRVYFNRDLKHLMRAMKKEEA